MAAVPDASFFLLQVAAFPKQNGSRPRMVIFTQGKDSTVVATHGKVRGSLLESMAVTGPICVAGCRDVGPARTITCISCSCRQLALELLKVRLAVACSRCWLRAAKSNLAPHTRRRHPILTMLLLTDASKQPTLIIICLPLCRSSCTQSSQWPRRSWLTQTELEMHSLEVRLFSAGHPCDYLVASCQAMKQTLLAGTETPGFTEQGLCH